MTHLSVAAIVSTIAKTVTTTSNPPTQRGALHTLHSLHRQRGSSLSSMMGGMLVAIVAIVAGWGVYKLVSGGNEVQIEAKHISGMIGAGKMLKSAGSYAGVNTANLQKIKGFGNMTGSEPGGTVKNAWGGTVTVAGAVDSFTITYADVPESACPQLLAMVKDSSMIKDPMPTCAATGASSLSFVAY